jgi:translation initiation factor 2B subunit (eIF-2B alpha/beta/delta family)
MPRQSHSPFYHLNNICVELKSLLYSLCCLLCSPVTLSILGSNIQFSNLYLVISRKYFYKLYLIRKVNVIYSL